MDLDVFLRQQTSERKLRLFAVACCNQVLDLIDNLRSLNAIQLAELFAEGLGTEKKLQSASRAAYSAVQEAIAKASVDIKHDATVHALLAATASAYASATDAALFAADYVAACAHYLASINSPVRNKDKATAAAFDKAKKIQKQIAEDIFHPSKLIIPTSTLVLAIAKNIYEKKQWSDMPILADALEDAGWNANEVLDHLHSNQPHYRGCWVLDLILNKH